jgi:hypothetical protein
MTGGLVSPSKGKAKRPASDTSSPPPTPQNLQQPPTVVRRNRHRRRVVAAEVWGPQLPMAPHKAPGQKFNVYKAVLRHPNLFFQFAIRLDIDTLVELYAIDKEFHFRFNQYSISIIAELASYHAPEAAYIFSWIMFPDLCISDPMLRPMDGRPHLARDIPSLRWVKMVIHHDYIVCSILSDLAEHGLRVPAGTKVALMKFWLLIGMKRMNLRTAFLSGEQGVWTDAELLNLLHFVVKLDMRITHPVFGNGMCTLSHMLLTQKTLTTLHTFLKGKAVLDYDDVSEMLVRTYPHDELDLDTHTWLEDEIDNGVPNEEHGMLCHEDWDTDGDRLEPALDIVIMEAINRGLRPQYRNMEWMMYGFVSPASGTNIPAPQRSRHDNKLCVPTEPWPTEIERKKWTDKLDSRALADVSMRARRLANLQIRQVKVQETRPDGNGARHVAWATRVYE